MSAARRKKTVGGGWLLFWLVFFVGVTLLFMLNLERIKTTLRETGALDSFVNNDEPGAEEEAPLDRDIEELNSLLAESGSLRQPEGAGEAGTGRQETSIQPENSPDPASQSAGTVERLLYLMRVDNTGTILWSQVKRNFPVSDRPLYDTLEALLIGPSSAEERQGIISLIPKNSRIISAVVRGNTAYINLNEDFLFNTYGAEGYAGQRGQIVLTATEFNNVKDVQILIDGKRVDYLGEGIWIGSPVNRNML